MGFWDFIFGKPVIIEDDFFGEMIFNEWPKKPAFNNFECEKYFKPSSQKIGIGINADKIGPTQIQKDFFKEIENNYDLLIQSFIPMIEDEFGNWKENFKIKDFNVEFEPISLIIPRCDQNVKEWTIAFSSIHDLNHEFTFEMKDWIPDFLLIDG